MTLKSVLRSVPAGMREPADPVSRARARYGKPFAHEPGSTYEKSATPFLSQWLAQRHQARRKP